MAAPTRRRFLGLALAGAGVIVVGGGAGALIGSTRDAAPDPIASPTPPAELTAAIAREQALLEQYRLAGASTAGVSERVARIVADHAQHLTVLANEGARITGESGLIESGPIESGPIESGPPASRPARTLQQELDALRELEHAAATDYAAACLAGRSAPPADIALHVLMGSIAACETVHEAMLR